MKKVINLWMPIEQWQKMAECVVRLRYVSRTAFILDAIQEKINRECHSVVSV